MWRSCRTMNQRTLGSGRKPKIMTARNINRLKGLLNNWSGTSTRKIANKFKYVYSYIVKILKNKKTNICYIKEIQIFDRTDKKLEQLQLKCGRICRKFRNREFIIDESYFTFKQIKILKLDFTQINGKMHQKM